MTLKFQAMVSFGLLLRVGADTADIQNSVFDAVQAQRESCRVVIAIGEACIHRKMGYDRVFVAASPPPLEKGRSHALSKNQRRSRIARARAGGDPWLFVEARRGGPPPRPSPFQALSGG